MPYGHSAEVVWGNETCMTVAPYQFTTFTIPQTKSLDCQIADVQVDWSTTDCCTKYLVCVTGHAVLVTHTRSGIEPFIIEKRPIV